MQLMLTIGRHGNSSILTTAMDGIICAPRIDAADNNGDDSMPTKNYRDLKEQLAKLQKEAEAARIAEMEAVIAEIREKVAEYGITSEQIFGRQRAGRSKAATPSAPKYRNPKTGETWTGRGRAPGWIKDVKNRDRFLIQE